MAGTINGTTITVGNGSLTDAGGNVYTIVALGGGRTSVYENGSAIVGGDGGDVAGSIVEAEYANGAIYLKYPSGHWYSFSSDAGWSNGLVTPPSISAAPSTVPPAVTPPMVTALVATPPASGQSPNGTIITTDSGSITDAEDNVYTIVSSGGGLTSVHENGSAIQGGDGGDVAGRALVQTRRMGRLSWRPEP